MRYKLWLFLVKLLVLPVLLTLFFYIGLSSLDSQANQNNTQNKQEQLLLSYEKPAAYEELEPFSIIEEKLFKGFATSDDEIKQQAWQILQYAAYLDPDFISMQIAQELFPQKNKQVSGAIKKLELLSLISIIEQNGQTGFRIHRKLQKSVQGSVKKYQEYSINIQELMITLLNVLDKLFPEVFDNPDIKWQAANSLQPHVKKILDSLPGITNETIKIKQANLYCKLALYYQNINIKFEQALEYGKLSLKQRRVLFKDKHHEVANILNIIGNLYRESGNNEEGLKYLLEGLKMRQQLYKTDHKDIAVSLYNIGMSYSNLGKLQEALKYTQMAVEMQQRLHLDNSLDIAQSFNSLGKIYCNQGNFEKSLSYFKSSLQMFKILYKGNHIRIATLLNNLAYNYYKLHNYVYALKNAKAAVDMLCCLYPDGHPSNAYALRSYGAALIELNKVKEGLDALHQALNISKKFSMDSHFITAFVNYNLAIGYFKNKEYEKALEYAKTSLSLRQTIYATVKNHSEVVESLHSLADIYLALDDKAKALEFYNEALVMSLALSPEKLLETKELKQKIKELQGDQL